MKRRILGLLVVLTLLLALPFGAAAEETEKKEDVIVTVESTEVSYGDNIVFKLVDIVGNKVTDGTIKVRGLPGNVENGSAEISTESIAEYVAGVDTPFRLEFTYTGGSKWKDTTGSIDNVKINSIPLDTVTMASDGYTFGAPVANFGVKYSVAYIKKADFVPNDDTFGEKAYAVCLELGASTGYKFDKNTKVTLDGKVGKYLDVGKYEFQLDELYPTFTIIYDLGGGTITGQPTSYNKYSGTVTIPNPTKTGYKFLGWTGEGIVEPQTDVSFDAGVNPHDRTYTAKWRALENYTVTFHNAEGHDSGIKEQTVQEDSTVTKPADPEDTGYVFKGWYTDETYAKEFDFSKPITKDTDIYAHWVKICEVSFNANGHSTATGMPKDLTVEAGEKITKPTPDPADTGYVFKGWYTNNDLIEEFDFSKPIKENTTLYAKWAKTYTVTFNANGHGKAPDPQTVEEGAKATKPADPTEKGWRFDGWYTDTRYTTKYTFKEEVTEDIALYAKWTQMYTLTFETNGGTKIDSVEAPAGSLVYLGDYKPTKSGYYFAGWHTDKSLTQASRVSYVKMDGNKTVYAKFSVADKTNPKTADPAMPGLALAVLSFSGMGLAAMGFKKRK